MASGATYKNEITVCDRNGKKISYQTGDVEGLDDGGVGQLPQGTSSLGDEADYADYSGSGVAGEISSSGGSSAISSYGGDSTINQVNTTFPTNNVNGQLNGGKSLYL